MSALLLALEDARPDHLLPMQKLALVLLVGCFLYAAYHIHTDTRRPRR